MAASIGEAKSSSTMNPYRSSRPVFPEAPALLVTCGAINHCSDLKFSWLVFPEAPALLVTFGATNHSSDLKNG
ncbi:hypothetical protein VPH35_025869 [Triticum aestivum]